MLGMGVTFGEKEYEPLPIPSQTVRSNIKFVMIKDLMSSKMMTMMKEGMPILISYRIVFESKHKLVPKGSVADDSQEKHVLLLQQEICKNIQEFTQFM